MISVNVFTVCCYWNCIYYILQAGQIFNLIFAMKMKEVDFFNLINKNVTKYFHQHKLDKFDSLCWVEGRSVHSKWQQNTISSQF